uniref:Uncharacterized protein n=1 Tax=Romanomermis culicivorax TaxID=13658 RepID=A0A915IWR8_ROMCU
MSPKIPFCVVVLCAMVLGADMVSSSPAGDLCLKALSNSPSMEQAIKDMTADQLEACRGWVTSQFLRQMLETMNEEGIIDEENDSSMIEKRKNDFLRFGKRKNDFLRFGKRKDDFLRFGKRKNDFLRFGKRKNDFLRFG